MVRAVTSLLPGIFAPDTNLGRAVRVPAIPFSAPAIDWKEVSRVTFPDNVAREMCAVISIIGDVPSTDHRIIGRLEFGTEGTQPDTAIFDAQRGARVPFRGSWGRVAVAAQEFVGPTVPTPEILISGFIAFGPATGEESAFVVNGTGPALAGGASVDMSVQGTDGGIQTFSMVSAVRYLSRDAGADTFRVDFRDRSGNIHYSYTKMPGDIMPWMPVESQISVIRITNLDPVNAIGQIRQFGKLTP